MPPKILPENLMLAEVMKRGGYRTGAVVHAELPERAEQVGLDRARAHLEQEGDVRRRPTVGREEQDLALARCQVRDVHGDTRHGPGR